VSAYANAHSPVDVDCSVEEHFSLVNDAPATSPTLWQKEKSGTFSADAVVVVMAAAVIARMLAIPSRSRVVVVFAMS
jgi:hypothetical protein